MSERQLTSAERAEILEQLVGAEVAELARVTSMKPFWVDELEVRKQKIAIGQLKIEKDLERLEIVKKKFDTCQKMLDELGEEKEKIEETISQKLPKKLKKRNKYDDDETGCPVSMNLCEAIQAVKDKIHYSELQKHPTGKRVHEVREAFAARKRLLSECVYRSDVDAKKVLNF